MTNDKLTFHQKAVFKIHMRLNKIKSSCQKSKTTSNNQILQLS